MKKNNSDHIKEINKLELKYQLYDVSIDSIPIWRLLRFEYRTKYLKSKTGFTNRTSFAKKKWFKIVKYLVISIFELLKVTLSRKRNTILFFAFTRLSQKENIYYDKFTDPIIKYIDDHRDVVVLQRSLGGSYFEPRMNSDFISKSDSILYICRLASILFLPFTILRYFSKFKNLKNRINKIYVADSLYYIKTAFVYGDFFFTKCMYKAIYKSLDVNQIFLVSRPVFAAQIVAAREMNIPVYELQHGATLNETVLYTGPYNDLIDPSLFLTFGSMWKNEHFGIPLKRIKNLGWANTVNTTDIEINRNRILIISSPSITTQLLEILFDVAQEAKSYIFIMRLHPQESLSVKNKILSDKIANLKIESSTANLQKSILKSKVVIGDNSTVLYEALSLNKPVGQINYGFFRKERSELENKLFRSICSKSDFSHFLEETDSPIARVNDIYSSFDFRLLNELITNK
ncbi:hypothetical protein [Dokdonia sp. PRO95]|uniref:hypothetical protein n=1 Tax=Dokdonia sp. PRO95 TaxID=1239415 RepID=UPI00055243C3|nr:hypothetical protein [Dokdonia sp. PRO95]